METWRDAQELCLSLSLFCEVCEQCEIPDSQLYALFIVLQACIDMGQVSKWSPPDTQTSFLSQQRILIDGHDVSRWRLRERSRAAVGLII